MQTAIEFRNIRKAYGEHVVLDGFDLKRAISESSRSSARRAAARPPRSRW